MVGEFWRKNKEEEVLFQALRWWPSGTTVVVTNANVVLAGLKVLYENGKKSAIVYQKLIRTPLY